MNYAYWFSNIPGIGIRSRNRILSAAGSAREVYHMSERKLQMLPKMTEKQIRAIRESKRQDWEAAYGKLSEQGISFISREEEGFPERLKWMADAPYSLYVKGRLPLKEQKAVAIVGARRCSAYGHAVAEKMGERLAQSGAAVVSGMAQGIDGAGHRGALKGGGDTYAVLGCGADVCYPGFHQGLYGDIIGHGGILSEYPPGTPPLGQLFPARNRIISGLSDVVVIVEAKGRSGSLITADYALEQGKDVYAVPGRMYDALSEGCNQLIRQGAGIVSSLEEFLRELGLCGQKNGASENLEKLSLAKDESMVYSCLSLRPESIGTLLEETGLEMPQLSGILDGLLQKGLIAETVKNHYIRKIGRVFT